MGKAPEKEKPGASQSWVNRGGTDDLWARRCKCRPSYLSWWRERDGVGDGEQWSFAVSLLFKHEGGGFPTHAVSQAHSAQVPCSQSQRKGRGSSADNSDVMVNLLSEAKLNLIASGESLLMLVHLPLAKTWLFLGPEDRAL